jgi:HSP20 family protein
MLTPLTRTAWVSPLERMYALQREIERTFDNKPTRNGTAAWIPPMDVVETADEVLCHIEVPGLSHDDLEIRVEDRTVIVSGEKKYAEESNEKENGFRSIERRYGRFERSFTLPHTVDTNNVRARHENGVLTIVLPKVEASKPRRIQIESGTSNTTRELNK